MEKPRTYTKLEVAVIMCSVKYPGDYDTTRPLWAQITHKNGRGVTQDLEFLRTLMNKSASMARAIYGSEWTNITQKGRMAPTLDTDHIAAMLDEAAVVLSVDSSSHIKQLSVLGYDAKILSRTRQLICSDDRVKI